MPDRKPTRHAVTSSGCGFDVYLAPRRETVGPCRAAIPRRAHSAAVVHAPSSGGCSQAWAMTGPRRVLPGAGAWT